MTRRGLGRGRLLITVGALLVLVGCFLPWYTTGGTALPAESGNAFEGAGILVFVAAIALLALVALPYAAGDHPLSIDRGVTFLVLAGLGVVGFVLRIVQLMDPPVLSLPDRAPGLWLAGAGLIIVAWGVAEVLAERPVRR
ncbi:hypothetical protein BH20CHL6_BH20CHL6_00770 [soil metagenome]